MNFKLSLSKFYSVLLVSVFFMGFQSSADAQLTVRNATSCTIYVAASQLNLSTPAPCDACNLVALTPVPAFSTHTFNASSSCGLGFQNWKEVFYSNSPSGLGGATVVNPGNTCASTGGPVQCTGTPINAAWVTLPAGAALVNLTL